MMDNIIFKPIIPLSTMIIFSVILLVIVLLNRKHIINRILILLLLLIITQRPMLKDKEDVSYTLNLDVIFVVDTTLSMNAVDVNNNTRINEVKRICNHIIEEFPGSKFSIITYDNDAYIKYPFTEDAAVIIDVIDGLKVVEPNYALGSSLSLPANFLKMLLKSADSKDEIHDEKRQKIVFFMGDGELNNTEAMYTNLDDYNGISDIIDNGAVIGIGTTSGGKIRIDEAMKWDHLIDREGYLLDNSKTPAVLAISKMNEQNLKNVSEKLGIDYIGGNSDAINNKLQEIKNIVVESEDEDDAKNDKDLYYYFSIPSLILLLYELFYYRRNES